MIKINQITRIIPELERYNGSDYNSWLPDHEIIRDIEKHVQDYDLELKEIEDIINHEPQQ